MVVRHLSFHLKCCIGKSPAKRICHLFSERLEIAVSNINIFLINGVHPHIVIGIQRSLRGIRHEKVPAGRNIIVIIRPGIGQMSGWIDSSI